MKIVVFGLSISSTWGNGHGALWRALAAGLIRRGHEVVFFERDVPYYAAHRDLDTLPGGALVLYPDWPAVRERAVDALRDATVAMVTSYCPDALAATDLVCDGAVPVRCFYDLDTPVTLARLAAGEPTGYVGPRGLADFDLVLSYSGGGTLTALRDRLGARRVVPIYGCVDPAVHRPTDETIAPPAALSYLGTYAADRQAALQSLFVEPARRRSDSRFLIGGAQYPDDFPWTPNMFFVRHLPPSQHPAFYRSAALTLNVTRLPMARMGHCPSGRLFEAAACGTPIATDRWDGLADFFEPDRELLVVDDTDDMLATLARDPAALAAIAAAGRARVLAQHTGDHRAADMEAAFERAVPRPPRRAAAGVDAAPGFGRA